MDLVQETPPPPVPVKLTRQDSTAVGAVAGQDRVALKNRAAPIETQVIHTSLLVEG